MIAVEVEKLYAEEAKKRQGERTDLKKNIVVNLPQCEKENKEPEKAAGNKEPSIDRLF